MEKYNLAQMFNEPAGQSYKKEVRLDFRFDQEAITEKKPGYRIATRGTDSWTLMEESLTRAREQEVLGPAELRRESYWQNITDNILSCPRPHNFISEQLRKNYLPPKIERLQGMRQIPRGKQKRDTY